MGARQIVHPVLEDDGPAGQIRQVTEGNDPLSQRADVLESRGEFSEAADLANLNENRRRELLVAIEPAANVARDAEVQLVAADCDDDRVKALAATRSLRTVQECGSELRV
jgi:hypothetical protein